MRKRRESARMSSREFQPTCGDFKSAPSNVAGKRSHWPAKFGGVLVCGISLVFEAAGQGVLWLAPLPGVALAGATLTGIGFSLVFPSMGVEATRRVPPAVRGRAVGVVVRGWRARVRELSSPVGRGHLKSAHQRLARTVRTTSGVRRLVQDSNAP